MLIFDSSTLILVAKIEMMGLFLMKCEMETVIPKAVENECCQGKKTLDALMIQKAVDESKIKTISVTDGRLVAKLRKDFNMGIGESEAIALALQERAQLVAIDDRNGIHACKLTGISLTNALGILVRSCERGLISRSSALFKLSALANFGRYSSEILQEAKLRLEVLP